MVIKKEKKPSAVPYKGDLCQPFIVNVRNNSNEVKDVRLFDNHRLQNDSEVEISAAMPNVSYEDILREVAHCPVNCGIGYIESINIFGERLGDIPIKFNYNDAMGNGYSSPIDYLYREQDKLTENTAKHLDEGNVIEFLLKDRLLDFRSYFTMTLQPNDYIQFSLFPSGRYDAVANAFKKVRIAT